MLKKLLILLLYFSVSLPLAAEFRTNVHSISRREGLSNGAVNTIVKDSEGYIWFGTWNGLNRYDGNSIATYLPGNNSSSIHNHVIRELYPTSTGAIWMLTNKGIGLYDNIYDQFTSYFTQESEPDILGIGTAANGLYTMKLTESTSKSLFSNQLAYPIIRSIRVTRKGDVLMGTKGGGIDIFNDRENHIRRIFAFECSFVRN
ncbi:MAG TPA: two-component regulator propeller domain-containing protein [Prolixibacteraceae bacterium]|nr:two-component regulator propeller domain-containing protein [Prolixibacteraceae bacterium]